MFQLAFGDLSVHFDKSFLGLHSFIQKVAAQRLPFSRHVPRFDLADRISIEDTCDISKVKTKQKKDAFDEIGWGTRVLTNCSSTSGTYFVLYSFVANLRYP